MKTVPWLVAFLFLLCGCAVQPRQTVRQQALVVDAAGAGAAIRTAPAAPWPDQAWWKAFGDPQLDGLMDRALGGSPRLAAADARITQARGLAQVANAALLPDIEGSADFEYTRFTQDSYLPPAINGHDLFDGPVWNNTVGAALSYRLDFWGRARAQADAARDRVTVAQYEAQDARLTLESALLQAYAALSYTYELQDNEQRVLADERRTLELVQRRRDGGLGTEMEVQQASAAVADTDGDLTQLDNRLALLRDEIAAICGQPPAAADGIRRPALRLPDRNVGLPATLPAELLGHRPDVLARRYAVSIAGQGIKVARAAFYPDVNLQAVVGFVGLGFGELLSGRAVNATAGPAITLPIFEGGRLRGQLSARQAAYDQAVDGYNATLLHALREVTDRLQQYQSLAKLRARRQQSLDFALRAHELALSAFRAGLTDYLNVLQTEREVARARSQMARVSFDQLVTMGALNEALGGGLAAPAMARAG